MALTKTFDGFVSKDNGSLADADVKYQAFFYKVNAGSSDSKWNGVRTAEGGLSKGYYSFDLGNPDFLGQSGSVAPGDIVVVVFWSATPLTDDRNDSCSVLNEWGAFEITMTSADVYTNQVQTKTNMVPILDWNLPLSGLVNTSYTATNDSYDTHSWTWSGTGMNHWYDRHGQTINAVNYINNTGYDWDDGNQDNNLPGAANMAHQWTSAGSYEVEIVIEDECVSTVTGTRTIDIRWRPPVPDIIMIPADPDPNVSVSFKWDGTDIDGRITSIDWEIVDTGSYGNTTTTTSGAIGDTIPHSEGLGTDWCGQSGNSGAFTNPGSHDVNITYHWFDGFDWQHDTYSESFTQGRFTGPTVSFTQVPSEAVMASGVKFVNTSTNTSRVGLGLPDCAEYDWRFTDDGVSTDYLDNPYTYELEVTPGSIDCQTRLCANYSDGWDTQQTCVTDSVPFATTVIVTDQDCYHHLEVYGTSDDGTVSGYSWTISSGISDTGPWVEVWSSPTGMDQQEKDVYFCTVGWYKIEGFVYGSGATTSDDEVLYISETCPGTEAVYNIWNGTGALDIGTDWNHSGDGVEADYAMYNGTNGLDADLSNGDKFKFGKTDYISVDIQNYDYLTMMLNVRSWQANKSIKIKLSKTGGNPGDTLNLENYVDTVNTNDWQKVFIPLSDFNIPASALPGHPIYADYLQFSSKGNIHFYLDDVKFSMGTMTPVPICEPLMLSDEQGQITMTGQELKPSMKAGSPAVQSGDVVLRPFPKPGHLN